MSSLTQCNFCTLEQIKADAKKEGKIVVIDISKAGIDVYVHSPNEKLDRSVDSKGNHGKQWQCWFMELGASCEC